MDGWMDGRKEGRKEGGQAGRQAGTEIEKAAPGNECTGRHTETRPDDTPTDRTRPGSPGTPYPRRPSVYLGPHNELG